MQLERRKKKGRVSAFACGGGTGTAQCSGKKKKKA
jgi:hypothetical protein